MTIEIRGYYQEREEVMNVVKEVILKSEYIHPKLRKKILNEIKQKLKGE